MEPDGSPPLGLPVLAEVPELAAPLVALAHADRLQVQAILALVHLLEVDRDLAAERTGVGLEHWLALTAGSPALERRTWLRAARLLGRLPGLRQQVEAGRVTAGQLRGLTIALRGAPREIDDQLDAWLAASADRLATLDAEPDALVQQARQALAELTTQVEQLEEDANRYRFLHIQRRLDGSGGTFTGSEDAYGLAMLEAATRPRADQAGDTARGRADNLQAILHGAAASEVAGTADIDGLAADVGIPIHPTEPTQPTQPTDPTDPTGSGGPDDRIPRSWAEAAAIDARLAEAAATRERQLPSLVDRIVGYAEAGWRAPPTVLIRTELSTLLDRDRLPTDLLVALTGGRLRATSTATRQLIDAHGASLRLVVTDDGHVVGVGRSRRVAPRWLGQVMSAIHDTCTAPLSEWPAVSADTDHAVAWDPEDDRPGGRTDLDNLGPLNAGTNRNRPASGWRPEQTGTDGVRRWHHPRSGLVTTSIPATWRPPTRRPPPPDASTRSGEDADGDRLPFRSRPGAHGTLS